jgi:hypothetical protein
MILKLSEWYIKLNFLFYVSNCIAAIKLPLRRTLVLVNGESAMVNKMASHNLLTIHELNVQVSDTTGDAMKYYSR